MNNKQVRLEDSIHKRLKIIVAKKETSIQKEVNHILKEWLKKNGEIISE